MEEKIQERLNQYLEELDELIISKDEISTEEISNLFLLKKLAEIDVMLENLQTYVQK